LVNCDFSFESKRTTLFGLTQNKSSAPVIPEKFKVIQKIEKCIVSLNQEFCFTEETDKLNELIKIAQIVFLKGYGRLRIQRDKNNKLAQLSIRFAIEKLKIEIEKELIDRFTYWNIQLYGKFFHLLEIEEKAYLKQKDIVKDFWLYSMYQDMVNDLEIAENFQTYKEIEEIFSQLVIKGLHIGKNLFNIYYYCIAAVIIDDIFEDSNNNITPELLFDILKVESKMYQNLIKQIFEIKALIHFEFEKMICKNDQLGIIGKKKEDKLLTEIEKRKKNIIDNEIDLIPTEKEKLIITSDFNFELQKISKKMFNYKDYFKEVTLDSVIFFLYRFLETNLITDYNQILKIIYTSINIFDTNVITSFEKWFNEDLNVDSMSGFDLRNSDELQKLLDEFLNINQFLKKKRYSNKIKIRDSILDYKLGKKKSHLTEIKKYFVNCRDLIKKKPTKEEILIFFNNLNKLIENNQQLNPDSLLVLCSLLNHINKSSIDIVLDPKMIYNIYLLIINEFRKNRKIRKVKLKSIKMLLKAIITYDQPLILWFTKNFIKRKQINEEFILFLENYTDRLKINLYSQIFYGKDSFSQIYEQKTLEYFLK